MAFAVQNDTGTTANANAYVSVSAFKSYHDDRGNSYAGQSDSNIEKAIVRATDFIDNRWRFKGTRLEDAQTTEWPRSEVYDPYGALVEGIPDAIKRACSEYALRALTAALLVDRPSPSGGLVVTRERNKVDVIEEEKEYETGSALGAAPLPSYPLADLIITKAGIIVTSSGRLIRA